MRRREPDKPGFELELCCVLALRPWTNELTSSNLFFFFGCTQAGCSELGLVSVAE